MNQNKKTRIPVPGGSLNPLAKAMEKKPRSTKKSQPETWYDEEIETVSQKQQVQSKTEQEKRKEALYAQLKKTEEELLSMQDLLDHREKLIKEAEEGNENPDQNENEPNGASEGGKTDGESGDKVEKITKKTMKGMRDRMQEMREKLGKMNRDTDSYLADIENTMQYLDSLETASDRLGPLSAETRRLFGGVDDEKIIAQIYKENNEPTPGERRAGQRGGRDTSDEKEEDVDGEEEEETPRDKPNGSKFFLTEKTATSYPVRPNTSAAAVSDDYDDNEEDNADDDTNDQ